MLCRTINAGYNPSLKFVAVNSHLAGLLEEGEHQPPTVRAHVNLKLIKANKCLHVLRTLRKEQFSQAEIDHLFTVLVFPNFIDGSPVYGASEPDRNIIQNFSDRCHKRRFISYPVSIKDLLKKQDCKKVTSINNHPLASHFPLKKVCSYNLRNKQCARPKINTERFMFALVNRLIFKHKLGTG